MGRVVATGPGSTDVLMLVGEAGECRVDEWSEVDGDGEDCARSARTKLSELQDGHSSGEPSCCSEGGCVGDRQGISSFT